MLSLSNIDDYLSFYCAPCLLGHKCANLFSIPFSMYRNGADRIAKLQNDGFILKLLYTLNNKVHLLLYSQNFMLKTLASREVKKALHFFGYECLGQDALQMLFEKLKFFSNKMDSQFPHEIGLFLGYPPQDVLQYYVNKGEGYIFSGYWKVYTNPLWAKAKFLQYDKARSSLLKMRELNQDKSALFSA